MAARVLDAGSLLSYLEAGPEAAEIVRLIKSARDSGRNLMICSVNWGEVMYLVAKDMSVQKATEIDKVLATLPIDVVSADQSLTRIAASYRADKGLPYTVCFAAALAKQKKAELVTSDAIFRSFDGELRIRWIRSNEGKSLTVKAGG